MTEYKVVIIGSGGTGKSALTIQYIQETFVDKYDPTIEDSYRKQVEVDGHAIMLDILDTAGQEEYSAMRDDYMSQGNGFLMVYSITDYQSFEDCTRMYESLIKLKSQDNPNGEVPAIPIVLAGNKSDLEDERSVTFEEGKEMAAKFGELCKFFETSAKDRINVDEVFEELVRLINRVHNKSTTETNFDQIEDGEGQAEGASGEATEATEKPKAETKAPEKTKPKKKSGGCSLL